jgi:CRISPR/Cas system endoribonuclease Cas6 (RAMP superfamily)
MFIYCIKEKKYKDIMTCLFSVQEDCTGINILCIKETIESLFGNLNNKNTSSHLHKLDTEPIKQMEKRDKRHTSGNKGYSSYRLLQQRHSCATKKGLERNQITYEEMTESGSMTQYMSRKIRYKPKIYGNKLGKTLNFTRQD